MKIVSTNIGEPRTVIWRNKEVNTGIFKFPVENGIVLEAEDVENDHVIDRKYHGGIDKACYAYSADFYDYWKDQFPQLDWCFGMFGENLTIDGLDEKQLSIGDVFEVGEAILEVSEPRQPCMKLNIRMNSPNAVKSFVEFGRSGTYFRVLKNGLVKPGDNLRLIAPGKPTLTVYDVFQMIYNKEETPLRDIALQHPALANSTKEDLM
jgi:MOSC domain-containing protein YiiM